MPIVPVPPVSMGGRLAAAGNTRVKGPGQQHSINSAAAEGIDATRGVSCERFPMRSKMGFPEGRPFTANRRDSASSSIGETANP